MERWFWFLLLVVVTPIGALLIVRALARMARSGHPRSMLFGTQFFHGILWPLPLVWLGLFALLVLRARWVIGSWPFPTHLVRSGGSELPSIVHTPLDPMEFPVHTLTIVTLLVPAVLSIAGVVLAHVVLVKRGKSPHPAKLMLSIAGSVALWLLIAFDPGGMFVWLAD